jgi:hypothetical protein
LAGLEAAVWIGGDEPTEVACAGRHCADVSDVVRAVGARAAAARIDQLLTLIRDVAHHRCTWIAIVCAVSDIVTAARDKGLVTGPQGAGRCRAEIAVFGALSSVRAAPGDWVVLTVEGIAARGRAWVPVLGAVVGLCAAVGDRAGLALTRDTGFSGARVTVITVRVDGAAAAVGQVFALTQAVTDCVGAGVAIAQSAA